MTASVKFSIAGKGLKLDTADDVKPYIEELRALKDVNEISLQGNTLGVEASKAFSEEFKRLNHLQVADLSDIFTGRLREEIPPALNALLNGLLECAELHTVDLSDNAFGIATIEPLESFLSKHVPLQHLILTNNGLGPDAGSRVGLALDKLASEKKKHSSAPLLSVICGRNRLENGSMKSWAKFLTSHGTIKTIRVYQNGIRQEGIQELLLDGLAVSPDLEVLDLHDNTFTLKGTQALSKVLHKWPGIKEIAISDCLLSANGGVVLGNALHDGQELKYLEQLKLQYNEIDPYGLDVLKKAIVKNIPNLKILELNGNRFSEDHEFVEELVRLFEERGFGELDELDDMEEETSDEEEEDEDEDEEKESLVKDAEKAEDENVAEDKSTLVDELAEKIATTGI